MRNDRSEAVASIAPGLLWLSLGTIMGPTLPPSFVEGQAFGVVRAIALFGCEVVAPLHEHRVDENDASRAFWYFKYQ